MTNGLHHDCPALLVTAPSSGQGKTMLTAAIARHHRNAGRRVKVFKCGPDFLDPMILEAACGQRVYQLDLFMCGEEQCRGMLHTAAGQADLILIEGAMGLFDGDPCAADVAQRFGLPVLAILDGSAMAQTFGALVHGLATYRSGLDLHAVLANKVGTPRHAELLRQGIPHTINWWGTVARNTESSLPSRHLGLVQASEVADLHRRLDHLAKLLPDEARQLPPSVRFTPSAARPDAQKPLEGRRIAIARDEAFAFIYPANVDWLVQSGATLEFFSPLADHHLPPCDAVWLPGGYPELHLDRLSANTSMIAALREHHQRDLPILAECGGMLYTCEALADLHGHSAQLLGIFPGRATMQPRLAALGMQQVALEGGTMTGHTFHYSSLDTRLIPLTRSTTPDGRDGEAIYRHGSLTASYMHLYFPSAPWAAARLFSRQASTTA